MSPLVSIDSGQGRRCCAGRGRLDRVWGTDGQGRQAAEATSAQLLAEAQLWRGAHGAELLDEQNSDLDRCLCSFFAAGFPKGACCLCQHMSMNLDYTTSPMTLDES